MVVSPGIIFHVSKIKKKILEILGQFCIYPCVSAQEAEKLVKMLISELRKALKARTSSAELIRPDNFLVLIQVRENRVLTS